MAIERLSDNRRDAGGEQAAALAERAAKLRWAKLAGGEAEEIASAASWGAVRAANSWEPSKGSWECWAKPPRRGRDPRVPVQARPGSGGGSGRP